MVNEFTDEDDESLAVYIATDYLREFDRHREDIYKRLVENVSCAYRLVLHSRC